MMTLLVRDIVENKINIKMYFLLVSYVLSVMYSPVFALFFIFFISINKYQNNHFFNIIVLLNLAFVFTIIYSSFDIYNSRDFIAYNNYYQCVNGLQLSCNEEYLYGYYLINKIVFLTGIFEPLYISFIFRFFIFSSLFCSVYVFILRRYKTKNILFVAVFSCAFFRLGSIGLLWRQSLATILIILLFSYSSNVLRIALYISSSFVHITSLLFTPFWSYFNFKFNKWKYVLLIIIFPIVWLAFKDQIYSILPLSLSMKMWFMLEVEGIEGIIDFLKGGAIFFILVFIIIFEKISGRYISNHKYNREKNIILTVFFVWGVLSYFIPHAFRLFYPFSMILISIYSLLIINSMKNKLILTILLYLMLSISLLRLFFGGLFYLYPPMSMDMFYYFY